jgi:hypothetical protein
MSQENVDSFLRGTAAYNESAWDAALATLDPAVEFDLSRVLPETERYRGYEGVKGVLAHAPRGVGRVSHRTGGDH